MNAAAQTTKSNLRIIGTSVRAVEFGVAALGAVALALAFPKAQQAWLAPLGAAGLFWVWQRLSWKRAFWVGWFAGTLFFAIDFSWFAHAVGRYVGPFAPAVVLVPALLEGLAFAGAGAFAALAYRRAPQALAPLAAACAFTAFEWLRSIGPLGVPFGQLGYTQAGTPLAVFAAYAGTYGVTLIICVLGAYLADALARRRNRALLAAAGTLGFLWLACYAAWPARHIAPAQMRVAAIQGNVAQTVKWQPAEVPRAIARYTELTREVAGYHPQLVLWPETVVATWLDTDPHLADRFSALAKSLDTTLVVGSLDAENGRAYNALYVFSPQGALAGIYDKRQLVPFAESFPAKRWLGWLPYTSLISGFSAGHSDTVFMSGAGLSFAPLICWESAFADLTHAQVRDGAQFLAISTDDAWFGTTSGPYQHAQIAQLRAIENGMWVLRAGSTGISGIIAPDGVWTERTHLDRRAVVMGVLGPPVGSFFARIGPRPVAFAVAALYLLLVAALPAYARRRASP